ncbi:MULTISPECIES: YncE family protein [unclassified Streptomyces]|uniref:YncE family protein n=1 Tax=unclassified Streptomyces TaxID=2593676 RepID=UPI0021087A1F|nr:MULTISPECIES: hypothetical protein [unclassified Streptomyces]
MFTLTSPSPQAAQARAAGFAASFAAGVSIPVGDTPQGIALTPSGARAYVANRGSNTVSVIDTATNTVTATVPVGDAPIGVHHPGRDARLRRVSRLERGERDRHRHEHHQ